MRGLIIKQPHASRIVRGEMPIIFLPGRAKGKFIDKLIRRSRKIIILSAMTIDRPVNEQEYPLGKAVGTVEVSKVTVTTKEDVLSGKVKIITQEYVRKYPWDVSKLEGKISAWFLKNQVEWDPPIPYIRMPGAQRWIKNVKLKRSIPRSTNRSAEAFTY